MKIVLGVDGSRQALSGVKWVAGLALSDSDEIIVAAIAQQPVVFGALGYIHSPITQRSMDAAWIEVRRAARESADTAAAELTGLPCKVQMLVRDGHPGDALARIAEEATADLIAVGSHGKGMLERVLLGSVSEWLLQTMPTAVLVAREPVLPPVRVLLATDGSPPSLAAARFLAHFPLPAHAEVEVLHVVGECVGIYPSDETAVAAQIIDEAVAALDAIGRNSSIAIRHGDAKRQILAGAAEKEMDLIVTGARGLGGFSGLVLGSVSRAVSRAAKCSVLVVGQRPGPSP